MPIYSETLPDELILDKVAGGQKILIVGCGGCANVSCCIHQGSKEPAINIFGKPFAMNKEIERLKRLLTSENYYVDSMTINGVCIASDKKCDQIINKSNGVDTVIVLSCTAGKITILNVIKNKNIVHGMRVKGFKSISFKRKGFNIYINSERS